ncbi:hypothetical protein Q7P37_008599 [Cladosporium fusiforme]
MPPRPKTKPKTENPPTTPPPEESMPPLPTPSLTSTTLRMSYRIGRGEQGVLTFEPYKSYLLPLWRFKTVPMAQHSLATLQSAFTSYVQRGDFVGADMARKFIQMGMTRARREREVAREGGERRVLERSTGHEGMEEKAAASEVFKKGWEACRVDEGYLALKREFQRELREWEKAGSGKGGKAEVEGGDVRAKKEEAVEVKRESDDEG